MSKIIDFARAQVGKPYVFGRSGPDSFDCSGLTKRAAAQIGLDLYHGATTQWLRGKQTGGETQYAYFGETGQISDLPMGKVAFLFNQDKKRTDKLVMAHTGLYDGNGRVVQAGGYGGRGVHDNPLDKRRWTHYAVLTDYWTERDEAVQDETILRRGDSGERVREMQTALMELGFDVGRNTGADGKFGAATEAAVKAFQARFGLPVTGQWSPTEWAAVDADIEVEVGAPVNDDVPLVDVDALLDEAEGHLTRLSAIVKALREVC